MAALTRPRPAARHQEETPNRMSSVVESITAVGLATFLNIVIQEYFRDCNKLTMLGTNRCPSGFVCQYVDEWFSQCISSDRPADPSNGGNCGARCTTALPGTSQYTS